MHGSDSQASAKNLENDTENNEHVDVNHFNANFNDEDDTNDVDTTESANTNGNNIIDTGSSKSFDATKQLESNSQQNYFHTKVRNYLKVILKVIRKISENSSKCNFKE